MKRRNHCVKRNYMVCILMQHEVEFTVLRSKYFPSLTFLLPTHVWKVWGHLDLSFLVVHIQLSSSLLSISHVCPHHSSNWSSYLGLLLLKIILSTTIDKGCSSPALVSLHFRQKAQMVPQRLRTKLTLSSIQGKPAPIWPLIYFLQLFLLAHASILLPHCALPNGHS